MAAVIGSLRADLSANVAHFAGDMGKAGNVVDGFTTRFAAAAKRVQAIGLTMSLAVTAPLLVFAKGSVTAFAEAEKSAKAVDAVLSTMGNRAGYTAEQLRDMAGGMEKALAVDADDILGKVTANLLTFGNVSGDVFRRAQEAAVDLSVRLGQDLQSSAIQLGKALNDPVKGITALSRVGVSFSASQKEMIKSLVATGDVAAAQNIILTELERQYGNVAEVAATTADGQLNALKIQWENLQETLGEIIVRILPPLIDGLKGVADWLQNLSPETLEWVVAIGGVLAALGPVITIVGAFGTALSGAAWAITAVLIPALSALLAHPIIAGAAIIGAGIGYIIDQLSDATDAASAFKTELDKIQNVLAAIANGSDFAAADFKLPATAQGLWESMGGTPEAKADAPAAGGVVDKPRAKIKTAREVAAAARDLARDLQQVKDDAKEAQRAVADFAGDGLDPLASRLREVDDRYADLKQEITESIAQARATVGSNAEASAAIKSLEASLLALEGAHAKATAAAEAQYQAEQRLADLDAAREAADMARKLGDLRDAKSSNALSPQQQAVKDAEEQLADMRADGVRRVAELEIARDAAQRENDAAAVERYNGLLALQSEYNAEVMATTGEQLVAAAQLRDAWSSFASQLSDQLADMIVKWDFDLNTIRDTFADIAKQLFLKPFLESATSGIGNFFNGLLGLPGKAGGGQTFGGQTYWVGEDGPELFTPKSSGYITPSDESAALAGRRGQVTVVQNITTPNADSFRKSRRQVASDAKRGMSFA